MSLWCSGYMVLSVVTWAYGVVVTWAYGVMVTWTCGVHGPVV